jgi:hypothetical protein
MLIKKPETVYPMTHSIAKGIYETKLQSVTRYEGTECVRGIALPFL